MSPPEDLDGLSPLQLKELVARLLDKMAELERINAEQREEIARLKGLKGRPAIKPSGMEKSTEPSRSGMQGKRPGRGKVRPRVVVEDRIIEASVPAGSRFKGYETYQVQELVLSVHAVRYLRERWVTADGQTIVAPLPDGTQGHFGPNLRRFVLMQYHQGQTTLPRLAALLQSVGLSISEREIQRLLTEKLDGFLDETRDVLRTGLRTSPWISVDDTGARHKAKNGYCTQIGNDRFSWFGTRATKSRLNFLDLLRAGHTDFVLNDTAFDYMRTRALPAMLIASLAAQPETVFSDPAAWSAQLDRLGFTALTTTPDPVQIATEGAIWGSIHAHDFLRDAVVLSDDAGQFAIGQHALCWVHAERLVHKLDAFTEPHRAAQQKVRQLIWDFYADLKAYKANPDKLPPCRAAGAVRQHLPPPHRLCHLGSPAGAPACQQGRVVDGAGAAGNPAAYQWFRERYPLPGHSPQGQRRDAQRSGAGLPRCLSGPRQDLRQTRRGVLGLSRQPAQGPRAHYCSASGGTRPMPRAASLIPAAARGFAGITPLEVWRPTLEPIEFVTTFLPLHGTGGTRCGPRRIVVAMTEAGCATRPT